MESITRTLRQIFALSAGVEEDLVGTPNKAFWCVFSVKAVYFFVLVTSEVREGRWGSSNEGRKNTCCCQCLFSLSLEFSSSNLSLFLPSSSSPRSSFVRRYIYSQWNADTVPYREWNGESALNSRGWEGGGIMMMIYLQQGRRGLFDAVVIVILCVAVKPTFSSWHISSLSRLLIRPLSAKSNFSSELTFIHAKYMWRL